MSRRRRQPLRLTLTAVGLLAVVTVAVAPASAQPDGGVTAVEEEEARRMLNQGIRLHQQNRSVSAWLILRQIPRETAAGRQAQRVLQRADEHYQRGLDRFHEDRSEEARQEFLRGRAIGPIDPHHFYELGELYRAAGLREQAIRMYGRYLAFMNRSGETVDPATLEDVLDYIIGGEDPVPSMEPPSSRWPLYAVLAAVVLAVALLLSLFAYLRRGWTLQELVDEAPDLHPRIAYAISCLRHELLKHRLGVLGDVVGALRSSEGLTERQLGYLRDRLFGGESLTGLWRIYLETFDRLSGRRLYLDRKDKEFRRAWQAVRALELLEERFKQPDPGLADKIDGLRRQIRTFERHLKWLSERLCRSAVDGQLLREAVFSVQSEPRAAAVRLDEIRFEEPPEQVFVEVFRSDLLIVLRNLVRNAILALGRQSGSRRVLGLEVALRTEMTGDESVLIKILDTSPEEMTTDDIYSRRLDRGLGLVAAAVTRYDGSVFVEPGPGDYRKAVVVRFFRAMGEGA